jgi:hypothetical protein
MTRFAAALVLALALTAPAPAALPPDRQAALDGSYAAIDQKAVTHFQQEVARGRETAAQAAPDIKFYGDQVTALRARYANSPYKKNFDAAYQKEMTGQGTPPNRPTDPVNRPPVYTPSNEPPFTLPDSLKLVMFIAAAWGCRKLWKKSGSGAKTIDRGTQAPISFSRQEQQQIAAAQQQLDQQLARVQSESESVHGQIRDFQAQAAAFAARAEAQAADITSSAVSTLNQTVPEYAAFLGSMEQRYPTAYAPWTSDVWKDFAEKAKPELPRHICVAHVREAGLRGEQGIQFPISVPLLAGKGPIIVRCDAASKDRARGVIHNILVRAALAAPAEIRFSLIDPFGMGAGFPMRRLLPHVRPSAFAPADELAAVMEDIRRINEAVVGQAESFASLTREQRAGELFEIIAVLDYPNEYQRDPRTLEYLARIGQSGPRAGRFLILEWNGAPSQADIARFQNQSTIDVAGAAAEWQFDPVAPPELRESLLTALSQKKSESTGGDWNSLVRPRKFFSDSANRVAATPVGERLTMWFGENQENKPCAHGMLAGQTGSGKSFLLHVLITGLAARYSPDEFQLFLVDGKQGVEFEHYRQLPHAQVVCLRTPPAIARSVLEDYAAEMDDRWEKFQHAGVAKLEDYRTATGLPMPRMLMVVDEYQQLLEGDPEGGSRLLSRVLEKGRAAGIHLLLGSQTFEVRGLPVSAMTHVHLRVALSLPGDYIQSMSAFNSEGKKLIRDLAPRGQVVINDESGRDGANHRGAVARLDEASGSSLQKIVAEITAAGGGLGRAVVLSGKDPSVLADNPFVQRWKAAPPDAAALQSLARAKVRDGGFGVLSWNSVERPLPLWLGRKFDVRGHLVTVLKRGPSQNLLALGSNTAVRLCMLANGLASLRSMRSMLDCEFLFLDGLTPGQAGEGMLAAGLELLAAAGARVQQAGPETASAALEAFAASARQPRNPEAVRLLIVSEPEYFPDLAAPSGYGAAAASAGRVFKDLLRNGPGAGTHVICTASGLNALSSVLPAREAGLFNHRVVQQTNEEESIQLFAKTSAARISAQADDHTAAMYVDMVQGVSQAQLFKAYAASATMHGDQSSEGLRNALWSLYETESHGSGAA